MEYKIVVDSCCDMTKELKERLGAVSVPLTIRLGEKSFVDDENLDIESFLREMELNKEKMGSAAPSPLVYKDAFEGDHLSFAVTLSSNLSSSNSSAVLGKNMLSQDKKCDVHVFDSKSASAGEILVALKIKDLIDEGIHKLKIITCIEAFIKNLKTYFVLDNINNLLKNGRLNKVVGRIISILHVKPVMGSDGDGNIAFFANARGEKQILEKLSDLIKKSGKQTKGERLVITHCQNLPLAQKLKNLVTERFNFKEILVIPMRGLSSVYANTKGIVMAF